jgi:hypothetical protein
MQGALVTVKEKRLGRSQINPAGKRICSYKNRLKKVRLPDGGEITYSTGSIQEQRKAG